MAPTEISSPPTQSKLNQQNNIDSLKNISYEPLKEMCHYDTVDNPNSSDESKHFEIMKNEQRRLDSFGDKWPVSYIKAVDLAEAGFFYLQREDQVQCAFCKLIIGEWEENDIPLQEHRKYFPKCPFLTQKAIENRIPSTEQSLSYCSEYVPLSFDSGTSKPRFPQMADNRKRLLSFEKWSHPHPSATALADCGFFYIGKSDFVTCFFCGNSQGFWQPFDIPLNEHLKASPDCPYLHLLKNRPPQKIAGASKGTQGSPTPKNTLNESVKQVLLKELLESEIIKKAHDLFPFPVIETAVVQHVTKTGRPFSSLHELATEVLEIENNKIKQGSIAECQNKDTSINIRQESATVNPQKLESSQTKSGASSSSNILLCKICMDEDINISFQPCGHFITCAQCADKISECPLCRSTIEVKNKTYLS